MQTHIGKWGASCAVRLPKMVVETLGLKEGAQITLIIEGEKLVIQKAKPKETLEELVAQMDPKYQPQEEWPDWPPEGEEVV